MSPLDLDTAGGQSYADHAEKDPMTDTRKATERDAQRRWIGAALREFPWVHLGLGLVGNALFVVGSVMFFWESVKTLAIWLFVVGSLGMLLGSVGEVLVRIEKRRRGDDQ